MQNLNSNLPAAFSIKVTGENPFIHEIVELAVVPLSDDLKPLKTVIPFHVKMVPRRLDDIDWEFAKKQKINKEQMCEIITKGMDAYSCTDLFVAWYEKFGLRFNKQLMPIAYDWPHQRPYLREWLGPKSYEMCIHKQYRDIQVAAIFKNDRAGWTGIDFPYPILEFTNLVARLKVERLDKDALDNARVTAEVYRRMIIDF